MPRTQQRQDENAEARRYEDRRVKATKASAPAKPRQAQPPPLSAKTLDPPRSNGKGLQMRQALASLSQQSQSKPQPQTRPRPPKTPAAQIGAAGQAHAAALNRARPIKEERPRPRPKPTRSISVREDEVHAGLGAVGGSCVYSSNAERAYSPPKRGGAKSREMFAAFGNGDYDFIPPPFDDPPSPRFGAFGDDFVFDLK